jgi:DNA-binding transcriptional LysR family regulator
MELRHLRYFVAVAEELHFRRAAERLHVAQPAVSEQVRKLEAELGVTLLERAHRSVSLTEAGVAMLEDAKRVLRFADVAKHSARTARERSVARLRIGYTVATLPASVPRALQTVRASAAQTETILEPGPAPELIEAVRHDRLDAAVVPLPVQTSGFRVTRLDDQHAVAVLPVSHPLAVERSIGLARVAPERLLLLPREANRPFYDAIIAACHEAGLSPSLVELPENDMEQVLLAVASGAGMALVPESVQDRFAGPGVRFVPLDDPRPAFTAGVVTRRSSEHLPTAAFVRALTRTLDPPAPFPGPAPALAVAAA